MNHVLCGACFRALLVRVEISHGQQLVPPVQLSLFQSSKTQVSISQAERERDGHIDLFLCPDHFYIIQPHSPSSFYLTKSVQGLHLATTAPIPPQTEPGLYHSGRSLADSTVFCLPRTISPIKESLSQSLAYQENDLQKMLDRKSQRHWNISMLQSMSLDVDTKLH